MKKTLFFSLLVFIFSALVINVAAQTNQLSWSKHKTKKWYKKKEWLGGFKIKPDKTIDVQAFSKQYYLNKKFWDEAFAFLATHDLAKIEKGKYPIDGDNVFASVTTDSTKNFDKTNWESHRKYIDLQYVIEGEELMGVYPVENAKVTKEYDEKRDAANYSAPQKTYPATPATFFIFFPTDAHRPNITPGGNKIDKKIVIKVKYAQVLL